MTYESVTDKLGRTIKVGDTVAVACLNFKRPALYIGTVTSLARLMEVQLHEHGVRALRIINGKVDGAVAIGQS